MKTACLITFALLLTFVTVPGARAIDEGQIKPRLNAADLNNPNTSEDIIGLTSGSGNVKGLLCSFSGLDASDGSRVHFYIDGGAVQTLSFSFPGGYPYLQDSVGTLYTGFIPMNLRFGSSLRVQLQRLSSSYGDTTCAVSWALD